MTRKQKKMTVRLAASAALLIAGVALEGRWEFAWIPFLLSYLAAGYDIPLKAARNISRGQVFDENFLMTVATFGAVAVGALEEAVAVMLFYQLGELFNDYAVGKSRQSIAALMDINPEYANLVRDGAEEQVDPYEVEVDDIILVKPGERVPLDGIVVHGSSSLDTKALTGEAMPADVQEGDPVVSGSINLTGVLTVRVTKLFDDSTVAKILELVENASSRKAKAENFITRFARVYTPIVVGLALILAILPSLFTGDWGVWVYRACSFLVVSCPCALVISVPLSFFGGMGAVSRAGMIAKGGIALENLARADTAVFDKTGTLTTGELSVTQVLSQGMEQEKLLGLAAGAESASHHPIARAIVRAAGQVPEQVEDIREIPGRGIHAVVDGHEVYAGNQLLMEDNGFTPEMLEHGGTVVYLAVDGAYAGCILLADTVKPGAKQALAELGALGVRRTVMLTGDREAAAATVAGELGLTHWYSGLLPQDKVEKVRTLRQAGQFLIFVGDGVNDAPVLALADVGVAMGGVGSDAAVEAADLVLLKDDLRGLPRAVRIARKTMAVAKQNIAFALAVKFVVLALSVVGLASMWLAVFADVGVAVLAILNATRAGRERR